MHIPLPPRTQALYSTTFTPPPLDGLLTVPEIIDWHLSRSGDHTLFTYADDSSEITQIRWFDAVKAIHLAAHLIASRVAPNDALPSPPPVVAIYATSDTITYFCTMMGIMRAGFIVFLISPRCSPAALSHLLAATDVSHVIVGDEPYLREALATANIHSNRLGQLFTVSALLRFEDLFKPDSSMVVFPEREFDLDAPAVISHTSGTTTLPKPVTLTHRILMQQAWIPWYGERDLHGEILSFHSIMMGGPSGVLTMIYAASCGFTISIFKPTVPATLPDAENVFEGMVATRSTIAFVIPPVINAWSRDPMKFGALKKLTGIMYGGTPLNEDAGDKLSEQGVNLLSVYGSTENGAMSKFLPINANKEWGWFTFSPHCHPEFRPSPTGAVEVIMKSSPSQTPAVINTDWDGVPAFATRDLIMPHPEKPGYWKFVGRTDDQLVLSTMEKMNAGPFEQILLGNPFVAGAVMFSRRSNVGAIIDPIKTYGIDITDENNVTEFKKAIWSTVEQLNAVVPLHGKISKEMIIIATPSKPLIYGMKGLANREIALADYKVEIEAL